jgi:selenocysteine lyase/cysteine desulfurase
MPFPKPQLGDRAWFPDVAFRAYVAHAGIAPVSRPSRSRVEQALGDYVRDGRGSYAPWARQRDRVRELLARLIGARAEDIALVQNTAAGLHAVALSIPFRPGERLVVFRGEYPTNVNVWQRVAKRFDLSLLWLDAADFAAPGGPDFTALDRALAGGVRLVALSEVQFQSGLRMPTGAIAERAHAAGAEVCVDAIQAVGAVPMDVAESSIDYLACGGHKWLFGVEGAGFLYVHPERMRALEPVLVGTLSYQDGLAVVSGAAGELRYDRPLLAEPRVFEAGSVATLGYAALEPSLEALLELGTPAIFGHVQRYFDRVEAPLIAHGFRSLRLPELERRSCLLSFAPPPGIGAGELVQALSTRGVAASSPDALLRFSPHWPNALEETDHLVASVLGATDELRRRET